MRFLAPTTQALGTMFSLIVSFAACSSSDDTDAGTPPHYPVPSCPRPDQAPLPQGDGGVSCISVGASTATLPGMWPDAASAAMPVVYVQPGAHGGSGTMASPYGDLTTALAASPAPATILVGSGTLTLSAALNLTTTVTIRGVGASSTGTVLQAPPATGVLVVGPATSTAPLAVSLWNMLLQGNASSSAPAQDVVIVNGSGTTVTLHDVAITHGYHGLVVDQGATLCVDGLSVQQASAYGIYLRDSTPGGGMNASEGYLHRVLLSHEAGLGLYADRAHVDIDTALVADNGGAGIGLTGVRSGAPCTALGAACPARAAVCPEISAPSSPGTPLFNPTEVCVAARGVAGELRCRSQTQLRNVAVLRNVVEGLQAQRTLPTATELSVDHGDAVYALPGPIVLASRLLIAGTASIMTPAGPAYGDGLYVGPTASITLDPDMLDESRMGHGSRFIGNARAGVLVDGDQNAGVDGGVPALLASPGQLTVSGALVGSNQGPGMFLQAGATAPLIGYTHIEDNGALGLGVTDRASINTLLCNKFISTRGATLVTGATSLTVADGLSMTAVSPGTSTMLIANHFDHNPRFGAIFSGFGAVFSEAPGQQNVGTDNHYGVGRYGTSVVNVTGNFSGIRGAVDPPPTASACSAITAYGCTGE